MTILYSGIWAPAQLRHRLITRASFDELEQHWKTKRDDGLHLESIDTCASSKGPECTAVFAANGDTETDFQFDLSLADLKRTNKDKVMRCLTAYIVGNSVKYAAAWAKGTQVWSVQGGLSKNDFIQEVKDRRSSKEHLFDLQTIMTTGGRRWVGLWKKVTDSGFSDKVLVNADSGQLSAKDSEFKSLGLQPARLTTYRSDGRTHYAGIWQSGTSGRLIFRDKTFDALVENKRSVEDQMHLIDLDARSLAQDFINSPTGAAADTVRLHFRYASQQPRSINSLIERATNLWAGHRLHLEVASFDQLPNPGDFDKVVIGCQKGVSRTQIQKKLLNMRTGFRNNDIGVYLAGDLIQTRGSNKGQKRGCASRDTGGLLLNSGLLSPWTIAHEIGHMLGLKHVGSRRNLMFSHTDQITVPAPDVSDAQRNLAKSSTFVNRRS